MIISERIFYVMEQKNITQLELSRRTGIATSNISDWKKTNPEAGADGAYSGGLTCEITNCDFTIKERHKKLIEIVTDLFGGRNKRIDYYR